MAEKNTHSILETIKKKMLKLDQKVNKPVEVLSPNSAILEDEFEDISSNNNKEQKAEKIKPEVAQKIDQKFEDDLGLDIEKSEEEKNFEVRKSPEKTSGSESFKDFNLDDLDLDNEEKTFASTAQINPAKKDFVANVLPDAVLDSSEIEKSEDEVEVEDSANISASSSRDVGPVDWLGNPVNSSNPELLVEDDLSLDAEEEEYHEEENHEEEDLDDQEELGGDSDLESIDEEDVVLEDHESDEEAEEDEEGFQEYEEEGHNDEELEDDLDNLGDEDSKESEVDEKDLDQEDFLEASVAPQKELPSFDSHQMENEEKISIKQDVAVADKISSQKQGEEILEGDLEFLEKLEPKKENEDFDFADLEKEEDDIFSETEKNEAVEVVTKSVNEGMNADPLNFNNLRQEFVKNEQVIDVSEPKIEKHEIELEFEKELMGFTSNASHSFSQKPVMPESNQSMMNMTTTMQNESLPKFEEEKSITKSSESSNYQATVRQVSDSVKKLVDAKNVVSGISSFSQSPALAELALHLMEPKIEKWFNDNLPELVERVVREEIKKMIPRE